MTLTEVLQALRPSKGRAAESPAVVRDSGSHTFVPLGTFETPTPQYFEEEALHVHDLLERASNTPSLTETLPHLQECQELINRSPQKEMYDPVATQRALATYVLGRVRRMAPSPRPPSLEDAVKEVIFSMQEQANGLMNPTTVERLALSMQYGDVMCQLANIVVAKRKDIVSLNIPKLMEDYIKVRESYLGCALDDIPSVDLEQEGRRVWRTTDRVVYRGAVGYYHTKLQRMLDADPLMVDPAEIQEQASHYLDLIFDYAQLGDEFPLGKCEYTKEERDELIAEDRRIRDTFSRKWQQREEACSAIEDRHDELYDAFTAAGTLKEARTTFDQLLQCSFNYSKALDISSLDGIVNSGNKKLAEFDATIARDVEGQFYIVTPHNIYQLGVKTGPINIFARTE